MTEGNISIAGLDKAKVLIALYEHARVQGLGFLQAKKEPMMEAEATALLESDDYFDYVHGRVMKVRISGDELNPRLYDRDNGFGAAEDAIQTLR